MTAKGKHWHIDANGVLSIGKGFKRGKVVTFIWSIIPRCIWERVTWIRN